MAKLRTNPPNNTIWACGHSSYLHVQKGVLTPLSHKTLKSLLMYRLHLFDKQASTHFCPTKWLKSTLCLHAFCPQTVNIPTIQTLFSLHAPTTSSLLPIRSHCSHLSSPPTTHQPTPSLPSALSRYYTPRLTSSSSVPHPNSPTPSPALTLSLLLLPPQPHSSSLPLAFVTPVWVPNIPVLLIRSRPLISALSCTFSHSLQLTLHSSPRSLTPTWPLSLLPLLDSSRPPSLLSSQYSSPPSPTHMPSSNHLPSSTYPDPIYPTPAHAHVTSPPPNPPTSPQSAPYPTRPDIAHDLPRFSHPQSANTPTQPSLQHPHHPGWDWFVPRPDTRAPRLHSKARHMATRPTCPLALFALLLAYLATSCHTPPHPRTLSPAHTPCTSPP